MIISFKLVLSSIVFSLLIISCQEPKHTEESVEIVPKDTIKEEVFPNLGHDAPYYTDSVYYGREKYIEYFAGNLPIILSVPHGGREIPGEIPDRSWGTMVTDDNTYEM